ncbi:MAG: glutathionylspermidine synthase family protein [Spirochaetia bacterium]|nr:glutathionylspermidine synthase family protein [Spirochaetia bacterium]
MKRISLAPRPEWQGQMEELGFNYHTIEGETYWDESACYTFTAAQIDTVEAAAQELQRICLRAVDHVITKGLYDQFSLMANYIPLIESSWKKKEPSVYGRFDLSWNGTGDPKMLEYNADTPTALLEASVAQWHWLQAVKPDADQFNSIHEKLIERWKGIAKDLPQPIYFACVKENDEDFGNVEYLRDTAVQAGCQTQGIFIEDIGWDAGKSLFVDLENKAIPSLFKLYPWEWIEEEEFGKFIPGNAMRVLEPAWKMLLSNKAILPILWELFPGHPNLLPSYTSVETMERERRGRAYVIKPILSREGANVEIRDGKTVLKSAGSYENEKTITQAYAPLPDFSGNHPVIGAWIIGDQAAGMGIREDKNLITTNTSRFVPHYFTEE